MPEPLVHVLQHAQQINARLDVSRLQRILCIYREFINRDDVEVGMAVTRDELECLLDFPTETAHVDFLCERFACSAGAPTQRIDLLTLLSTMACLCRGSLEQKAKLLFTLVDLDIEDEVVEAELALVVATCANGLHRLGLQCESVSEVDAIAIAYEAFGFLALDDGDKMTLSMFLKWCVFHPRPRALLDHLSCVFSTCRVILEMRLALNEQLEAASRADSAPINPRNTDQSHLHGLSTPAKHADLNVKPTVNAILGPVIGQVSSRSACILLECDAEGELICTLTDRLCGSAISLAKRSLEFKQIIFTIHGLSPGRLYDVSIEGLVAPCEGIVQTLLDHSPAFKVIGISSDTFLSGSATATATASSFMNDVVDHFLPRSRGLYADLTIHIGPSVCLTQELYRTYKLYECSRETSEFLDATIRDCIRRNWNLPEKKALLSRGAHFFFGLGTLSSLVSNAAVPLSFLRRVHSVVQEYERVGHGHQLSTSLSEKYMWRLQSAVGFLVLDTFENILCDTNSDFAHMQETILSPAQWSAAELWLNNKEAEFVGGKKFIHQQIFASNIKLLVILLDIPLVWEAIESEDNTLWRKKQSEQVTSWNLYPNELEKMLMLIFRRLNQDPAFRVTVLCCGSFAARSVIKDTATGLSMEQITLGPISTGDPAHLQPSFPLEGGLFGDRYTFKHDVPKDAQTADQYCTLNIVPHAEGSVCSSDFYIKSQFDARIVLGPVIGRVTSKSARILVEFDRPIEKLICVLTDTATSQRFTAESAIESFWPTVIKVESLRPGCRYAISFEGVISNETRTFGYVQTPPLVSLTTEWIVVNHNVSDDFIDPKAPRYATTQWKRILSRGMPAYDVQSSSRVCTDNRDTLGEQSDTRNSYFNPWFHIEGTLLSNPLRNPHLVIHLGGQVNMQRAFSDQELAEIVIKLSTSIQSGLENRAILEIRHRMQEVYRVAWGIPPLNDMLAYSSNIMLLNEELDLFFSIDRIKEIFKLYRPPGTEIEEATLVEIANKLRAVSFELWQLYQNQLWIDVNEIDLQNISKNSRKMAFSTSFGLCRMVFLNLSHDVHELRSQNTSEIPRTTHQSSLKTPQQQIDAEVPIELFSKATWKILEDALEPTTGISASPSPAVASKSKHGVHQLVVAIPGDFIEWTTTCSRLRPGIVQLLEKLFAWKIENRKSREVTIICASERSNSLNFEVRDDKVNEQITLTCVGSISQPRDVQLPQIKQQKPSITKGYFSKRFVFKSIFISPTVNAKRVIQDTASVVDSIRCRTYASYQYLTDFRRGFLSESLHFFPPQTSPKAVLGPVIGRIIPIEIPPTEPEDEVTFYFSARVLLEINADTHVVCVTTDALANEEFRVGADMVRDKPHVFCINGLRPERRYVYRFEGISNSDIRRGSFYTPQADSSAINMVSVSSNFPDQMEETQDSLWVVMLERIRASWCGIDAILHLGGQVPLHEAAVESFLWVQKEQQRRIARSRYGQLSPDDELVLRQKVRRRFQQQYHRSWNLPNIREILASCSNWFLRAQADIAPFFRNHVALHTSAAKLVLEVAKEIFAEYQLSLMESADLSKINADRNTAPDLVSATVPVAPAELKQSNEDGGKLNEQPVLSSNLVTQDERQGENQNAKDTLEQSKLSLSTTNFIQQGEIGVFFLDMRAVPDDDVITCNNRLPKPLNRQERAVIGEEQWQQFESALKKKKVLALLLCMEFPLIFSNAEYVDQQRDALQSKTSELEETTGTWSLYDRDYLFQHWVACRRQLEQLLSLLFKWKAKRQGRDVVVFSGGMQLGLDTLLTEKTTRMTVRNFTTGPITRTVGTFDAPTAGIACPTFEGGAKDDRFIFTHSLVKKRNYIVARIAVTAEVVGRPKKAKDASEKDSKSLSSPAVHTAAIEADFVIDGSTKQHFEAMHPLTKFQRYPSWWAQYLPMGKAVFWDDTVILKAHSDDRMLALHQYLYVERGFSAALEVFYEKYQFAETTRMEELRSRHLQHVDLQANLFSVFKELWKVIPEAKRQFMAHFIDPFVRDFLLAHTSPGLFAQSSQTFELDFFCNLCREFVFSASLLHLTIEVQQEDVRRAKILAREQAERRRAQELEDKLRHDVEAEEESKRLEELRRSNPEEYAKLQLEKRDKAEKEKAARHEAKLEAKKVARLKEQEEERAIAKEQTRLNLLSENDPDEYTRRQKLLEARIRKLEDTKQQRAIERSKRKENEEAAKHAPS